MSFEGFKKSEIEGWNARASAYNDYTGQVTSRAIPALLDMAEIAPGNRVLDLCCGTGRAAGAAGALGAQAEGIDVSPAMVDAAQEAFSNQIFEVGDAEAIPRQDETFDAVICSFGLMHVASPEVMLSEIARVLKPGGRLALSHWIGPPESPLFRVVFGTIMKLADMSVVPPSPPPFDLSKEDTMQTALQKAGFRGIAMRQLPLVFTAPAGQFTEQFRQFAARAAVILDKQEDAVLKEIFSSWDEQLNEFLEDGVYRVPMPALAVSAVRRN